MCVDPTAVRAALTVISAAIVLAGCSTGVGGIGTLPPLSTATSDATTTAESRLTPQQRWYEDHRQEVTDHRDRIQVLRDQLAAAPSHDARVLLCIAGQQSEQPEYEQARQAPDVPTVWAEAVDLTRWMVASCAVGDETSVAEMLPLLDDALGRFDDWVAQIHTG